MTTDDHDQNKPKLNGVPINDAPMDSNPERADQPPQDEHDPLQVAKGKKATEEPASTKDVTYDVPPADLKQ